MLIRVFFRCFCRNVLGLFRLHRLNTLLQCPVRLENGQSPGEGGGGEGRRRQAIEQQVFGQGYRGRREFQFQALCVPTSRDPYVPDVEEVISKVALASWVLKGSLMFGVRTPTISQFKRESTKGMAIYNSQLVM